MDFEGVVANNTVAKVNIVMVWSFRVILPFQKKNESNLWLEYFWVASCPRVVFSHCLFSTMKQFSALLLNIAQLLFGFFALDPEKLISIVRCLMFDGKQRVAKHTIIARIRVSIFSYWSDIEFSVKTVEGQKVVRNLLWLDCVQHEHHSKNRNYWHHCVYILINFRLYLK